MSHPPAVGTPHPVTIEPTQRIVKIRRDYNNWVANETLEDYALRFTPRSFRKWSILRVSNTALGAISFLVLEAIGAAITVDYGFINAFWASMMVAAIVILTGLPISRYAASYGVDMDLLTRGAGFGYIGSTISSFIYASFTFILFALEAAIMAYALELYFNMPLALGYLVSALVVIPLVTHGITWISRIQMVTQPLWIVLMLLPFWAIWQHHPEAYQQLLQFAGKSGRASSFDWHMFASATAIGVALIPQIGEQVDFLRFMPEKTVKNRVYWHLGVFAAGPGWSVLGVLKLMAGALLAMLVLQQGWPAESAVNPTHMYFLGFSYVVTQRELALALTALFVVISQIKINMTNAYAGSLAWSNFFARLTHSHPGRVVWMLFNASIAIILMEFNVFQALEMILGLYANIAIAWIAAVVADLTINKPMGWSPPGIEFRRAYLYDINPVGVGAMLIASLVSILTFYGVFGASLSAFSAFIALGLALGLSPLLAWWTKGKYYLARQVPQDQADHLMQRCVICERTYEREDMAHCPAYGGGICSLCCSLDARCHDVCKPHARLSEQWLQWSQRILPEPWWPYFRGKTAHYLLFMGIAILLFGAFFSVLYLHDVLTLQRHHASVLVYLKWAYIKVFLALLFASGVIAWWFVLSAESRKVAQEESNRQTRLLLEEIESHKRTDAMLQNARQLAEEANQAKSRYITGISHELRTPLNSILGYAQLLVQDDSIPPERKPAIKTISRGGEHLLSLIESTLDIARIESGKMAFDLKPLNFPEFISHIVSMFEIQAKNKGLAFHVEQSGSLPAFVRADHKRLMQILVNILGNAVKFTTRGHVTFRVSYAREIAHIDIEDTGPGIAADEIQRVFEPFVRGSASDVVGVGGTGLGLTISKLLTELMGGEIHVQSTPGQGTRFEIRLFLSQIRETKQLEQQQVRKPVGYLGARKTVMVVDNEAVDRGLLRALLEPMGFVVQEAAHGQDCLNLCKQQMPDLILMDLAMPVMDGWEAAYQLRKVMQMSLPIGIISANAYDKNLDNQAGIQPNEFFVKPVQLDELVHWIGQQLMLVWRYADTARAASAPDALLSAQPAVKASVPQQFLESLSQFVRIGYIKGMREVVAHLKTSAAVDTQWLMQIEQAMDSFDLQRIASLIEEARA